MPPSISLFAFYQQQREPKPRTWTQFLQIEKMNEEQKLLLLLGTQFSDSILNFCDLDKIQRIFKIKEKYLVFQYVYII